MRLRHLALPAAATLAALTVPFAPHALAATAPACGATACTVTFGLTGAPQQFTVPAHVTQLSVGLAAGSGGAGHAAPDTATTPIRPGGTGGAGVVSLSVTPGETFTVVVGGRGEDATADADHRAARGGYGGGGNGTTVLGGSDGAGGGGTFLFHGSALVAAVGGGGGGGFADGGAGGAGGLAVADSDVYSTNGAAGSSAAFGGGGGSTSAPGGAGGGAGGQAGTGPTHGPAAVGTGGEGQPVDETDTCPAGGGGGGYTGGGAGGCHFVTAPPEKKRVAFGAAAADVSLGAYGGGGGGAGFLADDAAWIAAGAHRGDGTAVIGWTAAPTTTTLATGTTTLAPGQQTTLVATVAGPRITVGGLTSSPATTAVIRQLADLGVTVRIPQITGPVAGGAVYELTPSNIYGPPCTVTFFVNGVQVGDPVHLNTNNSQADLVFTAGSTLGTRAITARYDGAGPFEVSTSNTVALTVSGLADTGPSDVAPMLGASATLLLAGAGLVGFGRRRPGTHRAA